MESVLKIIESYSSYLFIAMGIVILILLILILVLWKSMNGLEKRYRRLMRGTNNKNLEALITEKLETIEVSTKAADDAVELVNKLQGDIKECVQKVAIMRYKAFEDVGSDLSFSIAILDGNNDGVLITGLYGRHDSTTYAKPIDKGISRYDLSEEEAHVLSEAIKKEL